MEKVILNNIKSIHFVGIGGSSMSGLAYFMLCKNINVSGSDKFENELTIQLKEQGAKINIPHNGDVIKNLLPELVVYTVAVSNDNPELKSARDLGLPIIDRAEFLGILMQQYKYSISVAGTHGKTTTTSMLASIIFENHLDPAIHIGGKLPLIGGNTRVGFGDFFVTEACEYFDSFLKLKPDIGIILNVEHDHIDYFKTFSDFKNSFRNFVNLIPESGCVIVCADDDDALDVSADAKCKIITYGISNQNANWTATKIRYSDSGRPTYMLCFQGQELFDVTLGTAGNHNILNSLASIAAAQFAGIRPEDCLTPLKNFTGADRRYEIKGDFNDVKVIDDYAHHPTEIKTTLQAAKSGCKNGRVFVAFQPHTFTRTLNFMDQFANAFGNAYKVLLADIYASREKDKGEVHSSDLEVRINEISNNCIYLGSFQKIVDYIKENAKPGDLVISMGAGDINQVASLLLK